MRMSCNGCRVLRKGCSDNCSIRPCLEWIKCPESQAHATVFLAKFYGRAGLMNLINAGPANLRPAIFRSLLYEACGRIVNPICGSVGLFCSGSWQLCQTAVEAVLKGAPITQIAANEAAENKNGPPLKAFDIRHVNKEENKELSGSNNLHRVRTRCRFKRSGVKSKRSEPVCVVSDESGHEEVVIRSPSHESSLSHQSDQVVERVNRDCESSCSAEPAVERADEGGIELELSLGFEPVKRIVKSSSKGSGVGSGWLESGSCKMELWLDYPDLREVDRFVNDGGA